MRKISLSGAPIDQFNGTSLPPPEQTLVVSSDNYDAGLITDAEPSRIPANALTVAKNVIYVKGQLFRRNGTYSYNGSPDNNKVMAIFAYVDNAQGLTVLRFTRNTINRYNNSGWTAFAPSGIGAMSGGDTNYFSFAVADSRLFFANGVDAIREVDPTAATYKALGDAPKYKYITSAFERVVGAYSNTTNNPVEVGWSGLRNYGEWNPLVDISAGVTPLVNSPSDTSDAITGIFYSGAGLIVPREKSIWFGISRPSATNPFTFSPALNQIGADCPRTIQLTDYGLVWYNFQRGAIYVWGLGGTPEDISGPIRRALKTTIDSPLNVWGLYSADNSTYSIFVGSYTATTITEWQYNFNTKTWSTAVFTSTVSCGSVIDFATYGAAIANLSGLISGLGGTINTLGGVPDRGTKVYGFSNGTIRAQAVYSGEPSEDVYLTGTDAGSSYDSEVRHKTIEQTIEQTVSNLVRASVTPFSTGTIKIEYSRDDGKTWTVAKTVLFGSSTIRVNQIIQFKKSLRFRRIIWRVTTSDCMCSFNSFNVRAVPGGIPDE